MVDITSDTIRRLVRVGMAREVGQRISGRAVDDAADRLAAGLAGRVGGILGRLAGRPEAVRDAYVLRALAGALAGPGERPAITVVGAEGWHLDDPAVRPAYEAELAGRTAAYLRPGAIAARPAGWRRNWGDAAHAAELAAGELHASYGAAAREGAALSRDLEGMFAAALAQGLPPNSGIRRAAEILAAEVAPRVIAALRAHYAALRP